MADVSATKPSILPASTACQAMVVGWWLEVLIQRSFSSRIRCSKEKSESFQTRTARFYLDLCGRLHVSAAAGPFCRREPAAISSWSPRGLSEMVSSS